jgi:hypothetical protein
MDADLQMDFGPDGYYTDDAAHEKISGYDNNQYQYLTEDDLSQEIIRLVSCVHHAFRDASSCGGLQDMCSQDSISCKSAVRKGNR